MKDLANKKAEAEKAAAANDPIKADKLENEAKTEKKVALYFKGAFLAIHPRRGIIATCPKGDSIALFINAMNLASIIPPVKEEVKLCNP